MFHRLRVVYFKGLSGENGDLGRMAGKAGDGDNPQIPGTGSPGSDVYGGGDQEAAAAFIAERAAELSMIARRQGLSMLSHLLDMTQLEADVWLRNRRRLS